MNLVGLPSLEGDSSETDSEDETPRICKIPFSEIDQVFQNEEQTENFDVAEEISRLIRNRFNLDRGENPTNQVQLGSYLEVKFSELYRLLMTDYAMGSDMALEIQYRQCLRDAFWDSAPPEKRSFRLFCLVNLMSPIADDLATARLLFLMFGPVQTIPGTQTEADPRSELSWLRWEEMFLPLNADQEVTRDSFQTLGEAFSGIHLYSSVVS